MIGHNFEFPDNNSIFGEKAEYRIPGTDIKVPENKKIIEFVNTYYEEQMSQIGITFSAFDLRDEDDEENEIPEDAVTSLTIKLSDLEKFDRDLCKALEKHPADVIKHIKDLIVSESDHIEGLQTLFEAGQEALEEQFKVRVNCDVKHVKLRIRDIGTKHIGRLVCVDGFVKSETDKEPKQTTTVWECMRCGHINEIDQPTNKSEEPFAGCMNTTCGKKGPYKERQDLATWVDFQRISLQEMPDESSSTKTRSIILEAEGDQTNEVEPGDRVTVTGILKAVRQTGKEGKKNTHDRVIEVLHFEKFDNVFEEIQLSAEDIKKVQELSKDPDIKNKIVGSIAPDIEGFESEKLAVALLLFSGVKKTLPGGTTIRGVLHAALVGEPGIAKSQLLRQYVALSPRGIFVSGKGSTAVGLTAAVVKDQFDQWSLEGGATVMANGGGLALDEINQADEVTLSALHPVMEQGISPVTKAGITASLKAECSILAAGNPKEGYFKGNESPVSQVGIPPALRSRFDFIFVIRDTVNRVRDTSIAEHIIRNHKVGQYLINHNQATYTAAQQAEKEKLVQAATAAIDLKLLKKYIAYARKNIIPYLPEEVGDKIIEFYNDLRAMKIDNETPVPITARSVEGMIRACEAAARMRLSDTIEMQDLELAKGLTIRSLRDVGLDPFTGKLSAGYAESGKSAEREQAVKMIFAKLRDGETDAEVIIEHVSNKTRVSYQKIDSLVAELKTDGAIYELDGQLQLPLNFKDQN